MLVEFIVILIRLSFRHYCVSLPHTHSHNL